MGLLEEIILIDGQRLNEIILPWDLKTGALVA